jgi:hypothetical protein
MRDMPRGWDNPDTGFDQLYDNILRGKTEPNPTVFRRNGHTCAEFKNRQYPPLKWIVPSYFPEGVTLFCGKPKTGKSWLMLAAALAVANGSTVLDQPCQQRNVLYFALEDGERRMHARVEKLLGMNAAWPENLRFEYECPPLDKGCIPHMQRLASANTELVVVDILGRIRGQKGKGQNDYDADYQAMALLGEFSRKSGLAVIVVHHLRKEASDNPFDAILGSTGLQGAADTLVLLSRHEEGLRMMTNGRDVEMEDKLVDWDPDTGIFNVTGNYEGKTQQSSDLKNLILDALERIHPQTARPGDVAKLIEKPPAGVRQAMKRMAEAGAIIRTAYGTYTLR